MEKYIKKLIKRLLNGPSIHKLYSRSRHYYRKGGIYKTYSYLLDRKIKRIFGCYLSPKASVGKNLSFRHPVGIVVGDGAIIGDDVTIYQNVTIGAARVGEGSKGLYPTIKDNVVIYAGAKLFGAITIGNNVTVGANAVVLKSVPDNKIAVGVPASIK